MIFTSGRKFFFYNKREYFEADYPDLLIINWFQCSVSFKTGCSNTQSVSSIEATDNAVSVNVAVLQISFVP